ncbi:hypothetical protein [Helicobacter canis]|uniref:Uncharacterized protein n=1 Tax=Helicobacter canis TaxID=29419 RepID=A0A377J7G9_9HELI|nr:hypothetical protein [Helicobacter canis]STO97796.1 Uncharacterised protein [Helicobacter canis]
MLFLSLRSPLGLKQSINQKVDSSDTKKDYFASAKFVDRHAANAARDDSKPPQVKKWILTILMTENTLSLFSISPHFFIFFTFLT